MMKNRSYLWGFILIAFGIFALLNNFNLLGSFDDFIAAAMFGGFGVLGLGYYFANKHQWWVLFPAFAFLGISGSILTSSLPIINQFSGGVFLFSLSLAFWLLFLQNQSRFWWAVIPGGILTTLALIETLSHFGSRAEDSVLFLGIAVTFGLLWLFRAKTGADWAKWVALGALAFVVFGSLFGAMNLLVPLGLIGFGLWILFKNTRKSNDVAIPLKSISDEFD